MILRSLLHRIRKSNAVRDTRGTAAIELGLITPAILSLFFGTVEFSTYFAVDRKVTITARSLSDLVAQATTINDADMSNVFDAAKEILTPYPSGPTTLTQRVTAVNIDANLNATVVWSDVRGSSLSPRSGAVSIPTGLKIANTQLIWGEVQYNFTPPVGKYLTGTVSVMDQFFARPRQSSTICRPPNVTTCS